VIHFDTTFLIDLQRELGRERPGPAFEFLEGLDDRAILRVSVFVVAELRLGAELARKPDRARAEIDDILAGLLVSYPTDAFASRYARESASLKRSGVTVDKMDLLIGTAALLDDAPMVTRNVKDFCRVPGLRVLGY
jgi:predicted nucleic acid-binding protein